MVAHAAKLQATTRPVEWDTLLPYDGEQGTLWQVWMRERGAGYWVMRYAMRLSRFLGAKVSNPNGLEDGGMFKTEDEAKDLCRIIFRETKGRYAVTISPAVIGRVYPFEAVMAAGDRRHSRRFDPFKTFDFSATDAVKEQARHVLVSVDALREIRETRAILTGALGMTEPRT